MTWSKEKRREYGRAWMRKRREAWFKDKTCSSCGSSDRLEIHHPDPEKKISHRVWSWSKQRRDKELSKCIVLCEICHKKETKKHERNNGRTPRIGRSGYKGVHFLGGLRNKPYQARPCMNGKQVSIGYFDNAREAALAVDHALEKHLPGSQIQTNKKSGLL